MDTDKRGSRLIGISPQSSYVDKLRANWRSSSPLRKALLAGMVATVAFLVLIGGRYIYRDWVQGPVNKIAVLAGSPEQQVFNAYARLPDVIKDGGVLQVIPKGSYEEIAAAFEKNEVSFAAVRSDRAFPESAQSIVILRKTAVSFVAPAKSKFDDVGDIGTATVAVLADRNHDGDIVRKMLMSGGSPIGPLKPYNKAQAAAADLRAGKVTAIALVGEAEGAFSTCICQGDTPRQPGRYQVSPFHGNIRSECRSPGVQQQTIEKSSITANPPLPQVEIKTVSLTFRLVSHSNVDRNQVAALVEGLYKNRIKIARTAPSINGLTTVDNDYVTASLFPVHKGALDYFRREKMNFYERYNDPIWLVIFYGGTLMSAMVWAGKGIFRAGDEPADALIEFISGRIDAIQKVESQEHLDHINDQILRSTQEALLLASENKIGLRQLNALSIAFSAAANAVARRQEKFAMQNSDNATSLELLRSNFSAQ